MNQSINRSSEGFVYIVGAGPGDKKLITVRGLECLKKADVVIYDLLLNEKLLEYCPHHAEIIKAPDPRTHADRQSELNQLLIQHAKAGKKVVRLKGGDPFIFGRGGEEALALVKEGLSFEVIPGVTSGIAASAYAGIPVTHRDYASSVAFVTGHSAALNPESKINWVALATAVDTLVIYMGVGHLSQIVDRLIENGRDKLTPVSLVRVGTTPNQVVVQGTLEDIVEKTQEIGLKSPAIIIIGEVNSLREHLQWFDNKPLFGKRILVTRARSQASEFADILEDYGADVIQFPTINIVPIDIDITSLPLPEQYHWVIFTSVNAVEIYYDRLRDNGLDSRSFSNSKICAIGVKTVESLERIGIYPDFIPFQSSSRGIAAEIKDVKDQRILLPRAKIATEELPETLKARGAIVDNLPLYETVKVLTKDSHLIRKDLKDGCIDMVTFTSSSTVRNFFDLFPKIPKTHLVKNTKVSVIGPRTAETVEKYGVKVDVVADDATIQSLVEAILKEYRNLIE
ncbi:uroporphyrinogen-III C-methyltransferase [Candidatus Poribacteria bacterium]|nr:MAG: uroporphyrinogen-III C-methyltransferase [Candidatus Poribacteria bacterium]